MSIGERRHSKYKDLYGKKTYRFCNLRKWKGFNKKQLTLLKMCVTSLLCCPRIDLLSFYGFLCNRFSLYIKVTLKALFRHANFYEKNIKILLLFSSVLWSMTFVYSLSDLLKADLIKMVWNSVLLKNSFLKACPNQVVCSHLCSA